MGRNRIAALTRVRHGDDLIAGPREVKDDGSRRPSLVSQMDLVCEGATPTALDEGQPRHLHAAAPVPRDRGHREIRVRVTGIERPWPIAENLKTNFQTNQMKNNTQRKCYEPKENINQHCRVKF